MVTLYSQSQSLRSGNMVMSLKRQGKKQKQLGDQTGFKPTSGEIYLHLSIILSIPQMTDYVEIGCSAFHNNVSKPK